MQGPAPVLWTRRPSTGADRPARLRIHAARGLLTAIASAPLFECRDRASPARPPASVATDLVLAWDEQKRRRGASQTAAPAGHCTSRCSSPRARRVLTGALRGEATAASGGALFAQTRSRGCQQARAVTPALRWTGSEQQSEPLASRCPFARTEESRPTRRDGCLAREMRKPNRATRTAAGALLLFWDLRLLVRHALSRRAPGRRTTASPR